MYSIVCGEHRHYYASSVKPFSVTNNSIGLRTAAAGNVDAAIVAYVAVRESTLLFVTERGFKRYYASSLRDTSFHALFLGGCRREIGLFLFRSLDLLNS